jgi:hypothetical protein
MWLRHWLQVKESIFLKVHNVKGDGECWLHAVNHLLAWDLKVDVKEVALSINREKFCAFLRTINSHLAGQMDVDSYLPLCYLSYLAIFIRTDILCINITAKKDSTTYERYTCPTSSQSEDTIDTFIILIFNGNHFNPIFGMSNKDENEVYLYKFEKMKYRELYELFVRKKVPNLENITAPTLVNVENITAPTLVIGINENASSPKETPKETNQETETWKCTFCSKINDDLSDRICVDCTKTWVCLCSIVRVRDNSMPQVLTYCNFCSTNVQPITVSSRPWTCKVCTFVNNRADEKCQECKLKKGTQKHTLKKNSDLKRKHKQATIINTKKTKKI